MNFQVIGVLPEKGSTSWCDQDDVIVVSVTGGLIGILLGWLIALGMSHLAGWAAVVSPAAVALAFLFSVAVGVIFGLWPARKAAALHPTDGLRSGSDRGVRW